jgi:hypothetical protein
MHQIIPPKDLLRRGPHQRTASRKAHCQCRHKPPLAMNLDCFQQRFIIFWARSVAGVGRQSSTTAGYFLTFLIEEWSFRFNSSQARKPAASAARRHGAERRREANSAGADPYVQIGARMVTAANVVDHVEWHEHEGAWTRQAAEPVRGLPKFGEAAERAVWLSRRHRSRLRADLKDYRVQRPTLAQLVPLHSD